MEQSDVNNLVAQLPKPLKWLVSDTIRTDHATHLVVQQQGSEFTFLFFETESLLFTGTPEEQVAQYEQLPAVNAKCVAKIVMSAEHVMEATNNLVESLNRFNAMMLQAMKGQQDARTENSTDRDSSKLSASS